MHAASPLAIERGQFAQRNQVLWDALTEWTITRLWLLETVCPPPAVISDDALHERIAKTLLTPAPWHASLVVDDCANDADLIVVRHVRHAGKERLPGIVRHERLTSATVATPTGRGIGPSDAFLDTWSLLLVATIERSSSIGSPS